MTWTLTEQIERVRQRPSLDGGGEGGTKAGSFQEALEG